MIFTPYTQPVKPAEFVGTVDLNVYAKGLANKQQMYEQNLKSVTDDFSKLFSINAYGPDKERLQALQNQLREEVGSINLSDLTDMGTVSKIKGLIRSYGSDPQMLEIAKRSNIYDSEFEKQQKAMEKGETYTSPALESLGDYYNQENFYEKPKGINLSTGWISPPTQKWMKEAREAVKKQVLNTATGVVEEVIDPTEARDYFMQMASSDPRFQKQLSYDFQKQTKGTDWSTEGQNYISEKIEEQRSKINQARLYGDKESELLATKELNRLETMSDPNLVGEELKNQYFDSWIQNEMDKTGYSMNMVSFKDYKRDPVYMENLRIRNNITEARMKEYLEAGYDPYTGKPIMVGGKPLSEVKKQQEAEKQYKPTRAQALVRAILKNKTPEGKYVITQADLDAIKDDKETVQLLPGTGKVKVTTKTVEDTGEMVDVPSKDASGKDVTIKMKKPPEEKYTTRTEDIGTYLFAKTEGNIPEVKQLPDWNRGGSSTQTVSAQTPKVKKKITGF